MAVRIRTVIIIQFLLQTEMELLSQPDASFNKKITGEVGVNSASDGQNDLLGYGYDVTGEFASSSASRFVVVDIPRFKTDYRTRVEWDLSSRKTAVVVS